MGRPAVCTASALKTSETRPEEGEAQGASEVVLTRFLVPIILVIASALTGIFWTQNHALKTARAELKAANMALAACQSEKVSITASAAACSRSVDEAATMSAKRATEAQAAVAAAQTRANDASKRVAALLRQRPADPNDLCRSADGMLTGWIKGRAKP